MGLRIIEGVPNIRRVDVGCLGKISEARASSEDGLEVNHDYADLRGLSLADLEDILEFETEEFDTLQRADFSEAAIEAADEDWIETFLLPGIDFGVASAVAALSALGCVPITSCRGNSLSNGHRHAAPTICFYCHKEIVPLLVRLAETHGVSIENNSDMLEVYASDLRCMRAFAVGVSEHLKACDCDLSSSLSR